LTDKAKLDQDFDDFNTEIERATEKELTRIRAEIDTLKDKASKISEALSSPPSNEEKRS
jgi:hypothetical protein